MCHSQDHLMLCFDEVLKFFLLLIQSFHADYKCHYMTNDISTFQAVMLAIGVASFATVMLTGTVYAVGKLWRKMFR